MSVLGGGNVPFSWEDLPGVSKFNTQKHGRGRPPRPKQRPSSHSYEILEEQMKMIPPPPPFSFHEPPRRSLSKRFLWKTEEEDPFLEALKECTKSVATNSGYNKLMKFSVGGMICLKRFLPKFKKSSNKSILSSCKGSCDDVEVNNLMMMPNSSSTSSTNYHLPIPRERFQGLIKLQERLRYT